MLGDMNVNKEKSILAFMAKITSIKDLANLFQVVVNELPELVGALGCWIYLQPEYVSEFHGSLQRGNKNFSDAEVLQSFNDFIVLAATNQPSGKSLVGKAYFVIGEGITGWVYENGKALIIDDVTDYNELKSVSPKLYWTNEYKEGDDLYHSREKRPLLVVPLILDEVPIGVLKFHATIDKKPFSGVSLEIARVVSQIITGVIRQTWLIAEQSHTISRLVDISNKNTSSDVIIDVTYSMMEMLSCSRAEFFIKSDDGASLWLKARNGKLIDEAKSFEFKRGENLVGWVFKTGLPLIVSNVKQFASGVILDDDLFETVSDGNEINDEDRFIKYDDDFRVYSGTSKLQQISFLAVPVKSNSQEVLGVLCGYINVAGKTRYPFDRTHLMLASSLASTISLTLESERQRALSDFFITVGKITEHKALFELVVNELPKFVSSSGCSIYEVVSRQGRSVLKLTQASKLNKENREIPEIEYDFGEGKTGIAAFTQATIIINHFGNGNVAQKKLVQEKDRIASKYPINMLEIVQDVQRRDVGLIQLRNSQALSPQQSSFFNELAKKIVFQETGISSRLDQFADIITSATWSYIAIPLFSENRLVGILRLNRSSPESPYSATDIDLVESIAGRLEEILSTIDLIERRKRLIITLAHEINTPLVGIMADSENIYQEAPNNTDLQLLAKHNLEQALRLHMQTSTIMSVLSEQVPATHFSLHSVYSPLKEACELFAYEAKQKGCEILDPKASDGDFPKIDMSLFELTIAFKNIIHNAVKYSFRPPAEYEKYRSIKIWGAWDRGNQNFYVIYIQNYGVGITKEEIEKGLIFQTFYRGEMASDKRRIGSGFGLAYARQVIEDVHHGSIAATSIPLGGDAYLTTFAISLPKSQQIRG